MQQEKKYCLRDKPLAFRCTAGNRVNGGEFERPNHGRSPAVFLVVRPASARRALRSRQDSIEARNPAAA